MAAANAGRLVVRKLAVRCLLGKRFVLKLGMINAGGGGGSVCAVGKAERLSWMASLHSSAAGAAGHITAETVGRSHTFQSHSHHTPITH